MPRELRAARLSLSPISLLTPTLAIALSLSSCAGKSSSDPAVFGGEGAQVKDGDSHPLTAESDGPHVTGPCATPPPPGDNPLLDDFEDGNNQLFKAYHREGWWYTASDGSEGEKLEPPKSGFKATALPAEEAGPENEMAAHFVASGQSDWGAMVGTTLSFEKDGLSCGYNASNFLGVEFRAKGPGEITVKFATPATSPPENGGVCQDRCWDAHGKVVRLKEGWNHYVVRWDQLQQGGWGTDARFEPERLLAFNFHATVAQLPADLWIDDLRFLTSDKAVAQGDAATGGDAAVAPAAKEPASAKPAATE